MEESMSFPERSGNPKESGGEEKMESQNTMQQIECLGQSDGTSQKPEGQNDSAVREADMFSDSLLRQIKSFFPGKQQDIRTYSPLTLAYIGDAVYDLIIRTVVVEQANRPANDLHHLAVKYVSANAQSKIVQALFDSFTEEEQSVYRRGKNAKPHTTAKNASLADYLKATGFEAVLGYLYLTDRMERLLYLVKTGISLTGL